MARRYTTVSLKASSAKYGDCEICKKWVSEVFLQTGEKSFRLDDRGPPEILALHPDHPDRIGWSQIGNSFGHQDCLERIRLPLED